MQRTPRHTVTGYGYGDHTCTRTRSQIEEAPAAGATVQVEVSEQVIDFLLAHKYELERADNASIGQAVSAFVSDAALEWA